ncbi:MAG TPA: preprotein translocase subunit SecA [Caldilineae bacterium]|nr:preprotein translocase subunit SecA [Caldilineae bacterium]
MLRKLLQKVIGDFNERELKRLQPLVDQINALEPEMERLPDEAFPEMTEQFKALIRERTRELRARVDETRLEMEKARGEAWQRAREAYKQADEELRKAEEEILNEILPRAFAAVREAGRRTIGLRHFDVQLMGGIVLHQGKIAEMKTGEGKTLVATLPLYLNALVGRGVHLVTPNDYLSKVGVQWMGPIYHFMGMSVGVIQSAAADPELGSFLFDPDYPAQDDRYQFLRPCSRREAYEADITYGTNNEFGFDYLRDNMVTDLSQCVQRELHYAIVDEVDNILIDEARTPLIISGSAQESSEYYRKFAELVRRLKPEEDYVVDEKLRVVTLTDSGISKIEQWLGIDNLYSPEHAELTPYLDNALRAHVLYKKDRDYIVQNGEVIIVDEFTGRLMYGRRYSEGLHQALEAKEGVRVRQESLTLATITFQNYFRMYNKLAGMTGTAATEAEEFEKIYNLEVVVIPTHKPMIRMDYPDAVYRTQEAKFKAVIKEIEECHKRGQPVLVGTVAIETSEMLSKMLKRRGIPHQVLNAKHHEREAAIIAQAGRSGAVTIATNMAGRGVDILLGGNPEGLARERLRREGVDLTTIPQSQWNQAVEMLRRGEDPTKVFPERWAEVLAEAHRECAIDREKVIKLGGLHVIGTERHEARRIDNQLRGRAGRQGDPGSSRFYVALDDDLMRRFGGQSIANLMERLGVDDDTPIEHNMVSKAIENAQIKVEGYNFDIRKHVLEYDDVVNTQREIIYAQRRRILSEPTMKPTIMGMIEDEIRALVKTYAPEQVPPDEWDLTGLHRAINRIFPLPATETVARWRDLTSQELEERLLDLAKQRYEEKERSLGSETMRRLERLVMLHVVDNRWVRHLTDLDALREGIGLRAYGQVDPLVAFKKEAHEMYQDLLAAIQSDIVHQIFHVEPVQEVVPASVFRGRMVAHRGDGAAQAPRPVQRKRTLGRNDPCWCGSGKKYKHCHMRQDMARGGAAPLVQEGAPQAVTAMSKSSQRRKRKRRRR